jgi:hypothetical protein
MAIVPVRTDSVREHQEKTPGLKKDSEGLPPLMQRDRSHSNPKSPSQGSGTDIKQDIDFENRYLFIARDISKELKEKPQGLEVSVAKHVADIFGFKHRSNVLVTTVRLPYAYMVLETLTVNAGRFLHQLCLACRDIV